MGGRRFNDSEDGVLDKAVFTKIFRFLKKIAKRDATHAKRVSYPIAGYFKGRKEIEEKKKYKCDGCVWTALDTESAASLDVGRSSVTPMILGHKSGDEEAMEEDQSIFYEEEYFNVKFAEELRIRFGGWGYMSTEWSMEGGRGRGGG